MWAGNTVLVNQICVTIQLFKSGLAALTHMNVNESGWKADPCQYETLNIFWFRPGLYLSIIIFFIFGLYFYGCGERWLILCTCICLCLHGSGQTAACRHQGDARVVRKQGCSCGAVCCRGDLIFRHSERMTTERERFVLWHSLAHSVTA